MITECPCCHSKLLQPENNFSIQYSGLGNSCFNNTFDMFVCNNCGLVFNSKLFDIDLSTFYEKEAFYSGLEHFNPHNPANINRNFLFYSMLRSNGKTGKILDVGCGNGAFVNFLREKGLAAVGVDFKAEKLNSTDSQKTQQCFYDGHATELPFAENAFDAVTCFHVLEHVPDIDKVCVELFRILRNDGIAVVEVPNAEQYDVVENANLHWFSSREHVYHFTLKSICSLFERNGFIIENSNSCVLPMASFVCTSLVIVARKGSIKNNLYVPNFFKKMQKKLKNRAEKLLKDFEMFDCIVVWGMGSAVFSLLPYIYEKIKTKLIIVDSNVDKQKLKYFDTQIRSPEEIHPTSRMLLLIGSSISSESIRLAAEKKGWENIMPIFERDM